MSIDLFNGEYREQEEVKKEDRKSIFALIYVFLYTQTHCGNS
jgi:hypothetical protein